MRLTTRRALLKEHGNELLEFALVGPLLVLLLAGGTEFGRAFYTYHILTKSVRNAARYLSASELSLTGTIPSAYVAKAKALAVYGNVDGTGSPVIAGLSTGQITIPATATAGPSGGQYYVTVSANYAYPPLFNFLLPSVTFQPKETMIFVGYLAGPG